MGLEQHLIEKINNVLLDLDLSYEIIDSFKEYAEESVKEEEFFKKLPSIDMKQLKAEVVEEVVSVYKSLNKHKAGELLSKYLKMLFQMGKASLFSVLDKTTYYPGTSYFKKFLEYGLSATFVIAYYATSITEKERTLSRDFISFYDSLYEKYKDSFLEAIHISEINEQAIIITYLAYKEEKEEYFHWLEEDMIKSVENLFNNNISEMEEELLINYLKGETSNLEETVETLKSNGKLVLNLNKYIFRFLIGISCTTCIQSEMSRRFIKFAALFSYKEFFSALHNYLKYNRYNVISNLLDMLQIKRELYIAWLGETNNISYDYSFEKELKQEVDNHREEFKKAASMCFGINKAYMAFLLWQKGEGKEFLSDAEEVFVHNFSIFMDKNNIERNVYENFLQYLEGDILFSDIDKSLEGLFGKRDIYLYSFNCSKILFWLKDVSPIFSRAMDIFIAIGNPAILRHIYNDYLKYKGKKISEDDLNSYIEFLESSGASVKNYIYYLGYCAFGNYTRSNLSSQAVAIIEKLMKTKEEEVIENIPNCEAESRKGILEILNKTLAGEKSAKVLIGYLGDSSKVVRETAIKLLSSSKTGQRLVIPSLSSKKQAIREAAVKVLLRSSDEEVLEALSKALEVEKSEKIKALLREALNLESALEENKEELDILEYCKQGLKGNKAATLRWLNCDTLTKVRFKDNEAYAEDEIIKYMLLCYASCVEIGLSSEALKVGELLDKKDLSKFALEVLQRWLDAGAESKKKWVLPFASVYGDYEVISLLKKNIEDWPKNSRGAIASEAVKALALNGSNEALIIVDNISRKFKFKQVKTAAASALKFAAEQMGVDIEELSDRIVPNLGFDIRGERVFDYGDRKFTVTLTQELTLEITDEGHKKLKNLPAIAKKDDEARAKEAAEEFKNLKKQLKTVINIQTIRLEMALSSNRKWKKDSWVKLFVENPIMHKFAIGLVWGIYKDNALTDSFRYMEDGSFNTKDEEEYELEDGMIIGIVHPIELNNEDMDLWKEQFENYEIKQPFEQLNREIFTLTEEEKQGNTIERFGGIMLNGLSLLGKLTGFGWSKGAIGDGGGYYAFYKEDSNYKVEVGLNFSGVAVGCENEEITVYDLCFYKLGTISKYAYINKKTQDQNMVQLSILPERFVSEILYQVNKAVASKTGTNDKWREEK
ncbi:DUF4132 domain-containing protein [Clostridiaceae bacterium UIB06]|uniref:DUF4132 domain-containing protein n=1 Tax=Clostridium thailandense TaxID=2794346 RepID=A0A949WRD4_9CLOT|nr:DUF4132 domain-containing protein [Clostridium thailandense]MBV7273890.1 DUF4132 domain-containing protein [Clostridium thailandense]MCH5136925.1 DUF4132 domain-containing protein [Clostridiaceae bacterium UIB06]